MADMAASAGFVQHGQSLKGYLIAMRASQTAGTSDRANRPAPRAMRRPGRLIRTLEYVYGKLVRLVPCDVTRVYRLDVAERTPPAVAADGFDFRFLSPDEMRSFCEAPETSMTPEAAALVEGGSVACFAALQGDALAAYACFASGQVDAEHNRASRDLEGIGLRLDEDARYLFKAFAVPSYRGQALMSWLIFQAAEACAAQGVREIVTTTGWTNRAFQISAERSGFRFSGRTAEMNLFGRHLHHYPAIADAPFEFVADT